MVLNVAFLVGFAFLLPTVVVERAGRCPDAATLRIELDLQLDAAGSIPTVHGELGEYRIRLDARSDERLDLELVDALGRAVLVRELVVGGASCGARARSVAVVVERWLSVLPAPPEPSASIAPPTTPTVHPPPAPSARPPRIATPEGRFVAGVQAGPTVATGVDRSGTFLGLGAGVAVRPLAWLGLALDGAVYLPHGPDVPDGNASVFVGSVRARPAARLPIGGLALDVELGPSLRVDVTSVSVEVPEGASSEVRMSLFVGVALAAAWRLTRRTAIHLVLDPSLAFTGQSFQVSGATGTFDVYRTPRGVLRLDFLASHDLF